MKKFIVLMVSIFVLSACTSSTSEPSVVKAQRLTIVSSASPKAALPAFTTFSWNEKYTQVLSASDAADEAEVKAHIKDGIIRYLATKGYVYQPDPIQADVIVGFLFALEDDIADKDIQENFGMLPGVNSQGVNHKSYKKGSLLLAVLDNRLSQVYWRSAAQGFIDLDNDKNEAKAERLQYIFSMMMGDFPKAGQ